MFTPIIMVLAIVGQANPDAVASPERPRALLEAIHAKAAARPKLVPRAGTRRPSRPAGAEGFRREE